MQTEPGQERIAGILSVRPARSASNPLCRASLDVFANCRCALAARIDNLRTTRDFLLPKLISGEISVEAADEAAAELVEQTA